MSAFQDGFLLVIGGFVAFLILIGIITILVYVGLKTGYIHDLTVGAVKDVIGY